MSCLGPLQGGEEQPEVTSAAGRSRGSAKQNLQPGAVDGHGLRELKEMVMQMQQQQAEFQKEIRLLMQGQAERHNSIHRPPQSSQDIPGLQAPGAGTGGGLGTAFHHHDLIAAVRLLIGGHVDAVHSRSTQAHKPSFQQLYADGCEACEQPPRGRTNQAGVLQCGKRQGAHLQGNLRCDSCSRSR